MFPLFISSSQHCPYTVSSPTISIVRIQFTAHSQFHIEPVSARSHRSARGPIYKTRCLEDTSRCTSDVTPSRLMCSRAKKLLSPISSVGRVTIAWDAWEVSLATLLDSYTSNLRRNLGMFTVSNFEAKGDCQNLSMAQEWGQQQTIDLVFRESPEILRLRVEDGYFFAHGGSIGPRSRRVSRKHCWPAATLQYMLVR